MFAEAIEEILKDRCSPGHVRAIEKGDSPDALWSAIAEAGFLELLASEEAGGANLTLNELYPVLTTLGRYAVPVPLAQSIAARALVVRDGVSDGMVTFAQGIKRDPDGSITCPLVPFGLLANNVIAEDDGGIIVLPASEARRSRTGVHGSLVATMTWKDGAGVRLEAVEGLSSMAAALHAALLAGAMQRIFDMTLQYANDRSQFGKSIGKFQAIQHQISVMAEHVAAASIAAESAFQSERTPSILAAAIAKSRTSEATVLVSSIAHAVHGAIGVTEEYDLQLFTRRLHEWRMAHGSEAYWNPIIGRAVLDQDASSITDFVRSVYG